MVKMRSRYFGNRMKPSLLYFWILPCRLWMGMKCWNRCVSRKRSPIFPSSLRPETQRRTPKSRPSLWVRTTLLSNRIIPLYSNIAFGIRSSCGRRQRPPMLSNGINSQAYTAVKFFFDQVAEMVSAQEPGFYVLACFDINGFKVINDQYGTQRAMIYCGISRIFSGLDLNRPVASAAVSLRTILPCCTRAALWNQTSLSRLENKPPCLAAPSGRHLQYRALCYRRPFPFCQRHV